MIRKVKNTVLRRSRKQPPTPASRITNETIAEHREKVIAEGRKFKYPVQYAKHRLVINALGVVGAAIILFVGFIWWQLYPAQNTDTFFYRITQIVPLPVASVDGQAALYKDYLMDYRSSIYWLQQKTRNFSLTTDDGKRQSDHIKRQALDNAIEMAYARKLAAMYKLQVSPRETDQFIAGSLKANGRELSRKAYEAVLSDSYGVSVEEYRSKVTNELLKRKVAFAVDATAAKKKAVVVQKELASGKAFADVAVQYSDDSFAKQTKGDMGFVPKNNADQGLVGEVVKLKKGEVSGLLKGTDAYYIVQLIDTNDTQVRYARIKIALKTFDAELASLKKDKKVKEYITLK